MISQYWDDENYRIFTFKMNHSGHLIVISSNDTNSRLYGSSEGCIGKSLYEIMEKEHADRWHSRFDEWKKSGIVSYIACFEDHSIAWDTTIEVLNDTLFGIGKKVDNGKLNLVAFEQYEFFNHFFIQSERYIIATLSAQVERDCFIIESIDTTCFENLSRYIGKDISSILFHCSNILDKKVYRKCIQNHKPVHYVEKYINHDQTSFFDVYLYPYMKNSKIIIYAKMINEQQYRQIQKKISNIYGVYPQTDYFGVCEISYADKNNPCIIGCNHYFKNLIEKTEIKLHYIINHAAFQTCAKTCSTATGDFLTQTKSGKLGKFKINVTHISEVDNDLFIVVLFPEEKEMVNLDLNFANLSKREREILTYAANGLTNRYIAKKLNITEGTVKKTIYNGYKKLGICSRIELIKKIVSL